ncbi:MAG: YebC/PmpR family DNA-binding transcriptional regulator [Chitinispirillia bacterium]|nr:YebC/PmpR family DNA-binding transcriptional regulator [Chitinispirillia bacterium]MCL2269200.1 YebC/PmpR family DNA-binding transcriptional regulator [Chitinispirillia bacterium]
MSGHSKWATIKRAKGKADAARGKLFNRFIREITIAARMGGGDPTSNPRLRTAISAARGANMPNKNIESAIQKGTGQLDGVNYEEITFEGYGPGGVAILIEVVTDNRNRIVAEVRHLLTKYGGNLGQTNCVARMFNTKGIITVPKDAMGEDEIMELVLEAGADDMSSEGEEYEITTTVDTFDAVREALVNAKLEPSSAEITKVVDNPIMLTEDSGSKVMKLVDALDDLDDTQHVYAGFDLS